MTYEKGVKDISVHTTLEKRSIKDTEWAILHCSTAIQTSKNGIPEKKLVTLEQKINVLLTGITALETIECNGLLFSDVGDNFQTSVCIFLKRSSATSVKLTYVVFVAKGSREGPQKYGTIWLKKDETPEAFTNIIWKSGEYVGRVQLEREIYGR